MKSLWASGRKPNFCRPSPMPTPDTPPDPSATSDWRTWYPAPIGSAAGFRKAWMRSKRNSTASWLPATGASSRPTNTKCPMRAPAANTTIVPRRPITTAVDRSGSAATRRSTTLHTARNGRRPRRSERKYSTFLTASAAVHTMTAIFANSEGCKDPPGTTSQRRAPLISGAIDSVHGSTSRSNMSTVADRSGQASRAHQRYGATAQTRSSIRPRPAPTVWRTT